MSDWSVRKIAIALTVCFAATTLLATGVPAYKINVTFDFYVVDKKCPPGVYTFKQESRAARMVYATVDGKVRDMVGTMPMPKIGSGPQPMKTWLVFNRYGEDNFLSEIWLNSIGSKVPTSKREKELIKGGATAEKHTIMVDVR